MFHFLPLYNSSFSYPPSCPPPSLSVHIFGILSLFLYALQTFSLVLSQFPFALCCSQVQAIENLSVKFLWSCFIAPPPPPHQHTSSTVILRGPKKCLRCKLSGAFKVTDAFRILYLTCKVWLPGSYSFSISCIFIAVFLSNEEAIRCFYITSWSHSVCLSIHVRMAACVGKGISFLFSHIQLYFFLTCSSNKHYIQ